jgi:CHAT domain-containing protein
MLSLSIYKRPLRGMCLPFMRDRERMCSESESRARVFARICVAVILTSVWGCSGNPEQELTEEFSTRLTVAATSPATVTRALPAGVYLIEVREDLVDLRVAIDAPGVHSELLDKVPRHGALYEVVRLGEPGEVRIAVSSADHPTKQGGAKLRIARWNHAIDAPPTELEAGYVALGAAGQQTAVATPASWAKAVEKLYEAVVHFERAGADAPRAHAAYTLAFIQYESRDEWHAAGRAAQIAIEAYASADDEVGRQSAVMLRAAADMEIAAGMAADTQRAELRALSASVDQRLASTAAFFKANGLALRAEYTISLLATRAASIGDYERAEALLSEALLMSRSSRDVTAEARTLANLAAVHTLNGQIVQAAREYEMLGPMIDRSSQPYQYAAWLGNSAFNMIAMGNFDRALQLHLEALDLYTRDGEEDERADGLAALGGLYSRMGDPTRAIETLRAAIAAQRQLGKTNNLVTTLRIAGNAVSALGDHDQALEYFRESARLDANQNGVAATRVLIAGELRAQGKFDAALEELDSPLRSGNSLVRANALEERARIALARGDRQLAIENFRAADQGYRELELDFNRIDANTELSRALLALGDIAGARAAADEAVEIVTRIRLNSANPEWRARFLSARYAPFEARIAVEIAGSGRDDTAAAWRAFRISELVRARSLADELASSMPASRAADDQDANLRARLTSQQLRLEARIQRQDPDEAGTQALRRAIAETRAQLDSGALRRGGVAARERAVEESIEQVRRSLPQDTAVLAYFVGDVNSYAWLLTRRDLRVAQLGTGPSLTRSIAQLTSGGQFNLADTVAVRRLAKELLGDLLEGLDARRLLVIADGPLHSVPFAALPVRSDELVVDRFVVGYAPSLALLLERKPERSGSRGSRVVIVSDPVYAPDDRRLSLASAQASGKYRGPPPESPRKLTRLPYSAMEAGAVSKALAPAETIHLAGFDATTENVMQLGSAELSILHFATHAIARSNSSEQSALFLTEYSSSGALLPASTLTPGDIQRSGLHAEVVVLSACATGNGNELRGEGVLGLTYGFLANGSRSVVASLWPIEDASTARFISEFYKAYRASGRAAEALRIAQLNFRKASTSSVWSSFVVRANEFP